MKTPVEEVNTGSVAEYDLSNTACTKGLGTVYLRVDRNKIRRLNPPPTSRSAGYNHWIVTRGKQHTIC